MSANSSLSLTSLDFDTLKQNLQTFMSSQSIYRDYNFLGSNLNVLLDVMSYNTYINSFYLNMIGSEAFLDTAQLRDSVVSHAKELNYVPRSARSAVATVSITFQTTGLNGSLVIPKNTLFTGKNANGSYVFVTDQVHTILSAGSVYNISSLNVYEGKIFTETFIVDNTIENQKFILSNLNIDDTSIGVTVTTNGGQNVTILAQATNLYGLTSDSPIFFIQEDRGSYYEIVFGDNVFGLVPPNAAILTVTYRVTNGAAGNGVANLQLAQNLGPVNGGSVLPKVSMTEISTDGSDLESTESVRFRAPRHYQVQDRAVTANDYKDIVLEQFPEVKDVNVFGGEDISGSVHYGTVFLSMITYSGDDLSDSRKTDVVSYLSDKKSLTVNLSLVNPDYIYLVPSVDAFVNFSNTALTPSDISTEIMQNIIYYNSSNFEKFNASFMLSKFGQVIDESDTSITGSDTSLTMYKNVLFANGFPQTVTFSFNNSITPGTIKSSNFVLSDGKIYQITDFNPNNNTFIGGKANGVLKMINTANTVYFNQISTNNVQKYINAGIVDYNKGSIYIQSIDVFNFMNTKGIKVWATPTSKKIYGTTNTILELDFASASIKVESA